MSTEKAKFIAHEIRNYLSVINLYAKIADKRFELVSSDKETLNCLLSSTLNYNSEIETETLHRSIYDVVVYNSKIKIDGTFKATNKLLSKKWCYLYFSISDLKGLQSIPEIKICDSTYALELDREDIREKYNYNRTYKSKPY